MKLRFLSLVAAIVVALSLIGCSAQPVNPAQQPGSTQYEGSSLVTSGDESSVSEVDRYQEIIQIPQGRFTIYFFKLDYHEGDTDKSGDSSLLISPDGKTMLIDSGNVSNGSQVLGYLKDLGITKLDYLVVSHPHIDHIGGIVQVAKEVEIGMHYRTALEYTTTTYVDYKAYFEKHKIPTTYLHEGDEFQFGDYIRVRIINPPETIEYPQSYPENSTQFVNDTSLTMRFDYGESSYLSCGDLYQAQEKALAEKYPDILDVDIAKANHHGKDTSNCLSWVKAVSPMHVVAMCDDIGSMTIYQRYSKHGAQYYNTSFDGIVRISMDDKKNYEVLTQHDSWLRDADK